MNSLIISLFVYLIGLFVISFFYTRKESIGSYFVNLKHTHLGVMTMSLVTTVLGSASTVVVVSEVYNSGISYGLAFTIYSIFGIILLATCATQIKVFGDLYKATTIPDFFARRFNRKAKYLTSIVLGVSLLCYTVIQLVTVSSLLTAVLDVPYWVALLLVASMRLAYTTIGGFRFGLFTDFLNGWILMFIFTLLAVLSFFHHPLAQIPHLPSTFWSPFAYAGAWWLIGKILLGGFVQVGNAAQWQRIVSAKDVKTVEHSFKLAIPIVAIICVIAVYLGLVSYLLNPHLPANEAIYGLVSSLLPPWLAGIIFATIIAVFATALDNQIIAGSAILYGLFYQQHDLTEKESVLKARLMTAILSVLGFLIAVFDPGIVHLQSVVNHIALIIGPLLVAILFSTTKRSNEAVLWAIGLPVVVFAIIYPIIHSLTFLITSPLALLIFYYYDAWTAPRVEVYK